MDPMAIVAEPWRQRLADDGRDVRRADEPPGTRGALRRRHAEALVGQQHDAHVRRVLPGAGRLVPVGLQDGLRHADRARSWLLRTRCGASPGPCCRPAPRRGRRSSHRSRQVRRSTSPRPSLVYFQFVFAAITPILMLGSVLGRFSFKAWIPFVLLWITFVYTVNAFLLWGGGYFAFHGALDYSGGYVIHLAAGISGFVAAAVIGPRLQRDREVDAPNNLLMVAVGAGLSVARLERLQRRGLLLRWRQRLGGGDQHQPVHRRGDAGVDRLGLHLPRQAIADRLGQRHDHRSGGDHAVRRFRQRLRCDRGRGDRFDDRVDGDPLPQSSAGVPTRGRHAGGDLHARDRRVVRRPDGGAVCRPDSWSSTSASTAHQTCPAFSSVFNGGSFTLLKWQALAGLWVIVFSGVMTFILLKIVGHLAYRCV